MRRPRAKVLWALLGVYMLVHTQQGLQQAQLWLDHLHAGHALNHTALGHLLLTVFELFTVSSSAYLLHGMVKGVDDGEFADRGFIVNGICQPIFQNLKAAVCPDFLAVQRTWWALEASIMLVGVLYGATPVYSTMQLLITAPLLIRVHCYSSCYISSSCHVTFWSLSKCFVTRSWTIVLAGVIGWAATYAVFRSQFKQQSKVCEQAASAPARSTTEARHDRSSSLHSLRSEHGAHSTRAAAASAHSHQPAVGAAALQQVVGQGPPSPMLRREAAMPAKQAQERAASARPSIKEAPAAAHAGSAHAARSSTHADTGSHATTTHSSFTARLSPIPFETFGVYLFRRVGMAPAILRFEDYVNRLIDGIDDGMVMRLVCMPIFVYSFVFALLVRMNVANYSFSDLSTDMFIMFIGSWFLLGRDSRTFDMLARMQQVQGQLAASLVSLAKPQAQTVAELVDSVRQQISGQLGYATAGSAEGDEVQTLELLGQGTFGMVHKGVWRGTVVAIKSMVLPSNVGLRRERMAIMEAAISAALSHPNVLQTYTYMLQPMQRQAAAGDAHVDNGGQRLPEADGFEVRLILEYMDKGTLRDALDTGFLLTPSGDEVHYDLVLDTAADVAKGMLHLHSLNIIHGDLKARNVLLQSSALDARGFTSKIADFGLSHRMEDMETHVSSMFQGTPSHMAPEVLLEGTQSKAADVYSFGITLWEIYTSRRPFSDVAKALLPHYVAEKGERPQFPRGTPVGYVNLTQRCWAADASARPSFQEIVACLARLRRALNEGHVDELDGTTPTHGEDGHAKHTKVSATAADALLLVGQHEEEPDPFVRWREVEDWELRPSKLLPSVPPLPVSPVKRHHLAATPVPSAAAASPARAAAVERVNSSATRGPAASMQLPSAALASAMASSPAKASAAESAAEAPNHGLPQGRKPHKVSGSDWLPADVHELPSGILLGGPTLDATGSMYC